MSQEKLQQQETKPAEKRPYVRPQLTNHGTVESQTQTPVGPSGPIIYV